MSYAIPFMRLLNGARPGPALAPTAVDPARLVSAAKHLYELRRQRDAAFGADLFSEPAWDMLLDLFISHHEGRQLSVSAVCIGARAPSATALRYLAILQEAGLVLRTRDKNDGRRSHIQLSVTGRQRMSDLLAGLVDC
jgi:DNA-binding MarR family transcriptional regulator